MVAYDKYNTAMEKLCNKLIDAFGTTDTWKVVIHTDAPQATDGVIGDLSQITGTGYTANGEDIQNDSTRTGGVVTCTAVDVTWTAGGAWPSAQYVSIFDDTAAADDLWCSFNYGATFTMASGETFTVDFGAALFTIQ